MSLPRDSSKETQACYPTVRIDVEADVCRRTVFRNEVLMTPVRLNRSFGNELLPPHRVCIELRFHVAGITPLEHHPPGCVSLEVIGVELDSFNESALCETNDRPVVSSTATALCLPSVAHVRGSAGKNEILAMAVVHVAALHHVPAVFHRREICLTISAEHALVGNYFSVRSQPRDAPVGEDVEAEMSDPLLRSANLEFVLRVSLELALREQWFPLDRIAGESLD